MQYDYLAINKFYYNYGSGNFGDTINNVFFTKLLNKDLSFSSNHNSVHYATTGSILSQINDKSIIWGSGFISQNSDLGGNNYGSNTNKIIKKPLEVIAVRGPLTRKKLLSMGIDCPENYGDPLMLFPLIYHNFNVKVTHKYGVIPHYIDKNSTNLKTLINNLNDVKLIDIIIKNDDYKSFIDDILKCEYIISSSLHDVMMGIIYRKKTIFVEFSNNVIGNRFKFYDFFGSLGVDYDVKNIYSSELINNVIKIKDGDINKLVTKMIQHCPFIEPKDKNKLLAIYNEIESKLVKEKD